MEPITPPARVHWNIRIKTVKNSSFAGTAILKVRSNNIRKSLGRKLNVISRLLNYVSSPE
jgi:hypothetical protein